MIIGQITKTNALMCNRRLKTAALVLSLVCLVAAQYYEQLQSDLMNRGLPAGTWTIGGTTEDALLSTRSGSTAGTVNTVLGESFGRALQMKLTTLPTNYWSANFQFRNSASATSGDVMLAIVHMRCIDTKDVTYRGTAELVIKKHDTNEAVFSKSLAAGTEWKTYYIPFTLSNDFALDQLRMEFFLGFKVQTLEFGGFALINYGSTVNSSDLPKTVEPLAYPGRETNAAWRTAAQGRIEELRKGDLRVTVKNNDGAPVPDARVTVAMQRHAFRFGTALSEPMITGTSADAQRYRSEFLRLFNYAVLENFLKWHVWQDVGTRETTLNVLDFLKENNIPYRGHNMLWPRSDVSPANVQALLQAEPVDTAQLRLLCNNHITDITQFVAKYPPVEWDVINETFSDLYSKLLGFKAFADWYKLAGQAVPAGTKLFINEACPEDYYFRYMDMLRSEGAPVDGIGIEGHIHFGDGYGPEYYLRLFDTLYNTYQTEIAITEFDYRAGDNADYYSAAQDALAADFTRDFLTACFSHPSMNSFLMWGFWNGRHWLKAAPIFKSDWTLRPSGQAYIDLVFGEWWTNTSALTDAQGSCATRGFLGTYEITVAKGDQAVLVTTTLVREGNTITVVLGDEPAPAAPTLSIDTAFSRSVALSWLSPESTFVGYDIAMGDSIVNNYPLSETTYVVNGLQPGQEYAFTIRGRTALQGLSGWSNPVTATTAEDYYSVLIKEFRSEPHALGEPQLIVGGNESTLLQPQSIGGAGTWEYLDVADQPFSRSLRFTVETVPTNYWQNLIITNNTLPIAASDSLWLVFFARGSSAATDSCHSSVALKSVADNITVVSRSFTPGSQWRRYVVPLKSDSAFAAGEVKMEFYFGYRQQVVEIGGIALVGEQEPPSALSHVVAGVSAPKIVSRSGIVTIGIPDNYQGKVMVTMSDLCGRKVRSYDGPSGGAIRFNTANLPAGTYLIRLTGGGARLSAPLTLTR